MTDASVAGRWLRVSGVTKSELAKFSGGVPGRLPVGVAEVIVVFVELELN